MIPRYYLRLHGCTSEDMSPTWGEEHQIRAVTASLYRRIRASTEQAPNRIGLDHCAHRGLRTRRESAGMLSTIRDPRW